MTISKTLKFIEQLNEISKGAQIVLRNLEKDILSINDFNLFLDYLPHNSFKYELKDGINLNEECNDFNKLINTKKSIFYLDSTENFFENVISNKLNTYSEINNYVDNQVKMGDLRKAFLSVPEFDYLGMKSQIEGLNAQKLANVIDNRLIKFYYEKE